MGQADTKKADISRPAASLTLLEIPYKYVTVFSISLFVMGFALPYLLYYLYGRRAWTHCMVSVLVACAIAKIAINGSHMNIIPL